MHVRCVILTSLHWTKHHHIPAPQSSGAYWMDNDRLAGRGGVSNKNQPETPEGCWFMSLHLLYGLASPFHVENASATSSVRRRPPARRMFRVAVRGDDDPTRRRGGAEAGGRKTGSN